jgi:hypothetical protein
MSNSEKESNNPDLVFEDGVPIVRRLTDVERKQAEAERRDEKYKQDQLDLNRKLVYATVALVFATVTLGVFQVWYMHRQWKLTSACLSQMGDQIWAAKDAANAAMSAAGTAHEALVKVQRAFIFYSYAVSPALAVPDPSTMKVTSWSFSVPFENSGDTPTRDARIRTNILTSKEPMASDFRFPDNAADDRSVVVGPRTKTATERVGATSPDAIKAVQDGKGHLYLYGWCRYRDVFQRRDEKPHITKFCFELTSVGGNPFSGLGDHSTFWTGCGRHNCTDEDCDKEKYPSPP